MRFTQLPFMHMHFTQLRFTQMRFTQLRFYADAYCAAGRVMGTDPGPYKNCTGRGHTDIDI